MGSTEKINMADTRFGELLSLYLRQRSRDTSPQDIASHLDEDTLAAFTEGNLSTRQADPLVSHLANCSFCRHKTAELVRLDLAFADSDVSYTAGTEREPARVSEVLSGILARLFGGGRSAVFAHEETPEEDKKEKDENKEDKA